jgi:superfamily I DNA and/or RNA helicase
MAARGHQSKWLRQLFPAWGCTLLSLGNTFWPKPECIDQVVIDEAGQCHPAYAVAALLRARSALVIGDTHQLEPVVGLTDDDERRIFHGQAFHVPREALDPFRTHEDSATSAQTLADRAVDVRPTLVDHFRCQPEIAAISEALCNYGLRAHTLPQSQAARVPELVAPVLHVSVAGRQQRFAGSWHNDQELSVTVDLTRRLLDAGMAPGELGVITPYRGQLERLWRAFRKAGVPLARAAAETDEAQLFDVAQDRGLALGTVHRFQGGERIIILLTTAVTRRASLGFLNGRVNLVNVAASRAREHLITIGHTETLLAGPYTRHLVQRATLLEPAMGRL